MFIYFNSALQPAHFPSSRVSFPALTEVVVVFDGCLAFPFVVVRDGPSVVVAETVLPFLIISSEVDALAFPFLVAGEVEDTRLSFAAHD